MKLVALLSLLFTACNVAPAANTMPERVDHASFIGATVRIRAFCDGELMGYGSGTAVSETQVLTVRHVAEVCEEQEAGTDHFEVVLASGRVLTAFVQKLPKREDVDAAVLVVLGGTFEQYAPVRKDAPAPGDEVFMYTGDGTMDNADTADFFFKHGFVAMATNEMLTVSLHCVPGNSGGGMFDAQGRLLAPLWGGVWDPRKEFYCEGWRPSVWADML